MSESEVQTKNIPAEVERYLCGAPPESRQFDFLIGDWDVDATKYKEDATALAQYKATWHAQYLNEGRMILDDFKALAPNGKEISSIVTLRTYSETTHRWEMTGLAAHQPAWNAEWHGVWRDGEMHLAAIGKNPEGVTIKNKIRFFNIQKNTFFWESKISIDDGKVWVRVASLTANRTTRSFSVG